MVCTHCGSGAAVPGRICSTCGRFPETTGVTAATATLTPPPGESDSETRLGTSDHSFPSTPVGPNAETQLGAPIPSYGLSANGTLRAGASFGSRYRILRVLGAGGMGVVYQAWDEDLGLAVALKTIRPEVMSDPFTAADIERRFKRELLLARQVTHRHVVRIHDLGEVGGVKYLTMHFIEGQTLSAQLSQSGKLPVPRALQITRQMADGLAAAHAAGVVHRDLKPENVMIDADGDAIIMDFGISRSLTGTGTGTAMGAVVGTLEYMSPEQASGERADQRADIYTLGLILYDLIIGRRRFAVATSPLSEAMARMQHAPPPIRTLEPAVPEAVQRIVARCLEPDPARRYQTIAELLSDLDRLDADGRERATPPSAHWLIPDFALSWPRWAHLALGAAAALLFATPAVVLVGMLAGRWVQSPGAPTVSREPLSVLIADFDNQAGDPVFQGSLEQALAIAMEGDPFITTFPRRDALAAALAGQPGSVDKLSEATARLVSQREGIKIVLAGAVARAGQGYRVDVRAVDAVPGTELATVSRTAAGKQDVLQAVAEVASEIRRELGDVTPESQRLADAETFTAASLEAARDYGVGQQLGSSGKYEESIEYYKRAIAADPKFGRAYATWAVSAFSLGRRDEAEQLYQQAFKLLDRMTRREEYRTLGAYYLSVAQNYSKAVENYSELVRLYPADRAGHSNLALSYFYTLNFPKALEHGRRATEIYGTSPKFRSNYALFAMYAGDFTTAGQQATELIKDYPAYYRGYLPIAMAAIAAGNRERARAAYETMSKVGGAQGASLAAMGLADLAMYYGRYDEAPFILDPAIARDEQINNKSAMASKQVALAEARLGSGDAAGASTAARSALELGRDPSVLVPAARVFIAAGRTPAAIAIAADLTSRLQPSAQAYGKLVEAEIALAQGRTAQAVPMLLQAQKLADLWMVRLTLGIAYVNAGHYAEGKPELELALQRRGEATAVFLDDVPSIRYLAPVHYWLGRAWEGLGNKAKAVESYKTFLSLHAETSADPLSADVRRRLGTD